MGSRHELDADIPRHRIERHPEAHVLFAVDAVVGLIVVPGRELAGAWLLHQDVLVEHPDRARAHQLLRDPRGRALEDEAPVFRDP